MLWFYLQTISGNHTWRERSQAHSSHYPKLISKLTSTKLWPAQIVSPHCPKPISKLNFKPFSKKKKKRIEPRARRESRANKIAHTTPDRTTTPNPRLHRSCRTPASARSHPSTCEIAPLEAPARSHPWPTHARSLSFSIYLSLSFNCWSLSLPPLSVWLNFWV